MNQSLSYLTDEEMSRLTPASEENSFGSLRTDKGHLPLKAMDVQVTLEGLLAQIELSQTFVNTHDEPLEATYIFPLPDRAAVTKFRLDAGGRVIEGVLQERGAARREYDRAITAGHRAAIAEEERPGVFTIRAGNIMPGENARVRLSLSGPLAVDSGEPPFRFPLVVAPRYMPGKPLAGPSVGDGVEVDTDAVSDASRISPLVLLPGYPNPVQLSFTVDVLPSLPVRDFRSSLHSLFMEKDDTGRRRFQIQPGERLNRDFILRYRIGEESIQTSLVLVPDEDNMEWGTFQLTLAPATPRADATRLAESTGLAGPRDIVFVLDRSGSMSGWKMVAARRAVAYMVESLNDRDRFAVYAFDDRLETAAHSLDLIDASNRNRFHASEYLMKIEARGGTEMARPLDLAVKQLTGERERILVLITDGQVGNEDQILRTLGKRLHGIRIFTLGIDTAVNAAFLKRLAALGGGSCDLVESQNRLDDVMYKVHRRIGTPVLSDIQVNIKGVKTELESIVPTHKLDLFAGAPVTITGRYKGAPEATAEVHAVDEAGRPWTQTVVGRVSHHPAAAVFWAKSRIREMEDQFVLGAAHLEKTIIQTSLKHKVLCRFTAFVAVDKSEVVNEGGKQHKVLQAVEMPAGWEIESVDSLLQEFAPVMRCVRSPLTSLRDAEDAEFELCLDANDVDDESSSQIVELDESGLEDSESESVHFMACEDAAEEEQPATRAPFAQRHKPKLPSKSLSARPQGIFSRLFGSGKDGKKAAKVLGGEPDLWAAARTSIYRKRAQELLDQVCMSKSCSTGDRLHALGVLRVKLRELLDDLRSTDIPKEVWAPLHKLEVKLDLLLSQDDPSESDIDEMWLRAERELQAFCGAAVTSQSK